VRAAISGALLLAGCSHGILLENHPLADRIWDVQASAFVTSGELYGRAASARYVILGEMHDNPEHHRLQRAVLEALATRDGPRALAMEQFDSEQQKAIDAAVASGADAEALADAGGFDRKGWNWPLYRPLVAFAREHNWPIVAANLSRTEARAIVADPSKSGLPPADAALRQALETELVESHCGKRPDATRLAGMVEAQRARDARLANSLAAYPTSVLVTGNGHARRDRGAPLYLPGADLVSIGIVEVDADETMPQDYETQRFDYVWFTPRHARKDPCAQ